MTLTQTRFMSKVSNFSEEKFQLSSSLCTCTTMKNSRITGKHYFKRIGVPIIVNPSWPGNIHEKIWPKPILCNILTQVCLWVWGMTHRRAIKVGNEAECFSGDPTPYSNHHSVLKTLLWCIILGTMSEQNTVLGLSVCPGRSAKKIMMLSDVSWH